MIISELSESSTSKGGIEPWGCLVGLGVPNMQLALGPGFSTKAAER